MNNYINTQLKQALAKMLPEQLVYDDQFNRFHFVKNGLVQWPSIGDTELLHLCWLVGKDVEAKRYSDYLMHAIQDEICTGAVEARYATANASWQQRVIALAKVKGVEIV